MPEHSHENRGEESGVPETAENPFDARLEEIKAETELLRKKRTGLKNAIDAELERIAATPLKKEEKKAVMKWMHRQGSVSEWPLPDADSVYANDTKDLYSVESKLRQLDIEKRELEIKKATPAAETSPAVVKKNNSEYENLLASRAAENLMRRAASKYNTLEELYAAHGLVYGKGDSDKELEDSFRKVVGELWKEIAVHGIWKFDSNEKKYKVFPFSDLDGKSAVGLLELAGLDTSEVKYVKPGDFVVGGINLDTGYQEGLVTLDDMTVFMDHHGKESTRDTSATKVVYEVMKSLDLLQETDVMEKLVKFITQIDNQTNPELNSREHFENSYRTILGLQRFISFNDLRRFFEDGGDPVKPLSDDDLKKYGVLERKAADGRILNNSSEQKKVIEQSKKRLEKLESNGFVIDTKYGRMVVDPIGQLGVGGKLAAGQQATRAYGYAGVIIWNPNENNFFIGLNNGTLDMNFSEGQSIRGAMWIRPKSEEKMNTKISEIIEKIALPDFKPTGDLKKMIDKEKSEELKAAA